MKYLEKPVILAIDDDPLVLNTVLSTLKGEYTVVPFPSAETALNYLKTKTADLILLDCHMPVMSGFQMLEILLGDENLKEIPVIFLTGSIDGDGEAAALQLGAVDYINKPIRPQVLQTRISVQLELVNHRKNLEKMVEEKTRGLNEALVLLKSREDITLNLLARVTEMRDSETGSHIERTTEFVRIIVEDLLANPIDGYELTPEQADDIIKSAKLHDLGKIAISDSILLKPGKLSPEEFDLIKTHTEAGERLLSDTMSSMSTAEARCITDEQGKHIMDNDNFLRTARDITYGHHEKWNGCGYPQGIKGDSIPLSARIVAIADVYDALTSERPYKKPFSHDESSQIITSDSGKHFDPHLVDIFMKHKDKFALITH
jgi:putative two-component system response regulator